VVAFSPLVILSQVARSPLLHVGADFSPPFFSLHRCCRPALGSAELSTGEGGGADGSEVKGGLILPSSPLLSIDDGRPSSRLSESLICPSDPPAPETWKKRPGSPAKAPERHDKGRHLAPQGAYTRVVACASQGELE